MKPKNSSLNNAFTSRKDEFYTEYEDIVKEIGYYKDWFRGKKVLCNCGDSTQSNFFKYFILNFEELGLTSLISTSYAGSFIEEQLNQADLLPRAYKAIVTNVPNAKPNLTDGSLDIKRIFATEGNSLEPLNGDGDFRSPECEELLRDANIVVTNPPFSLFREYISQLYCHNKDFIVLGNMNAATTKEIFPLFRDNKIWYGRSIRSGDRKFYVPNNYPLNAASCGVDEQGRCFIRVKGVRWFTNIDSGILHKPLPLTQEYDPVANPAYDNYNAIEVGRTANIPANYKGIMGVPITFLDKYSPDQFEILMLANGNARTNTDPQILQKVGYRRLPEDRGGIPIIGDRKMYARILIRKK